MVRNVTKFSNPFFWLFVICYWLLVCSHIFKSFFLVICYLLLVIGLFPHLQILFSGYLLLVICYW